MAIPVDVFEQTNEMEEIVENNNNKPKSQERTWNIWDI